MLSHLRILGNKTNLENPELVKETIALHHGVTVSSGTSPTPTSTMQNGGAYGSNG